MLGSAISFTRVRSKPIPASDNAMDTFIFLGYLAIAAFAEPSKITSSFVKFPSSKVCAGFLVVNVTFSTVFVAITFLTKLSTPMVFGVKYSWCLFLSDILFFFFLYILFLYVILL